MNELYYRAEAGAQRRMLVAFHANTHASRHLLTFSLARCSGVAKSEATEGTATGGTGLGAAI